MKEFKWNDELVKEFVDFIMSCCLSSREAIEEFKKRHSPKPLFTTDDGVEMFGKEDCYFINIEPKSDYRIKLLPSSVYMYSINFKYFSTEEAAKEYKLMNSPCLSLKDIEDYLNTVKLDSPTSSYIRELKKKFSINN